MFYCLNRIGLRLRGLSGLSGTESSDKRHSCSASETNNFAFSCFSSLYIRQPSFLSFRGASLAPMATNGALRCSDQRQINWLNPTDAALSEDKQPCPWIRIKRSIKSRDVNKCLTIENTDLTHIHSTRANHPDPSFLMSIVASSYQDKMEGSMPAMPILEMPPNIASVQHYMLPHFPNYRSIIPFINLPSPHRNKRYTRPRR